MVLCGVSLALAQDSSLDDLDLNFSDQGRERLIGLDQAIAAALRSNLEIQIESISPQVEADRTIQALGEFDPAFEARVRYDNLDTPQTSQEFVSTGGSRFQSSNLIGVSRVFQEENIESKAGITGKLRTGTQYDIGVKADRFRNDLTQDPFVSLFDPEYRSFAGISIVQPLLKDFGKVINEAQIKVTQRDKAIADQTFRQTLAGVIKDTVAAYYDSFLAYEDAKVKRFEVGLASRMLNEKRDQLERGGATPQDHALLRSALAESYERFLLSRQTLLTKNGDMLLLLQQDFDFENYPVYLPIESPGGLHPYLDPTELVRQAMEHRPEYLMAVQNVEKLGIVLKYRKNQQMPRVDLEGTLGYVGLSGNYGEAFSKAAEGQGHEYGIGLVVNVPFGNREKKGLFAETMHQKRQAVLKVKNEELQTQILINKHLTAVRTHEKRLDASRVSIRLAEENLSKAKDSLEKGNISESAVMKVERDVREARVREYAAAADLQKSLIDLWETNGTLLSRFGVTVNEATHEEPALVSAGLALSSTADGQDPVTEVPAASDLARPKRIGSSLLGWFGRGEQPGDDSESAGAIPSGIESKESAPTIGLSDVPKPPHEVTDPGAPSAKVVPVKGKGWRGFFNKN